MEGNDVFNSNISFLSRMEWNKMTKNYSNLFSCFFHIFSSYSCLLVTLGNLKLIEVKWGNWKLLSSLAYDHWRYEISLLVPQIRKISLTERCDWEMMWKLWWENKLWVITLEKKKYSGELHLINIMPFLCLGNLSIFVGIEIKFALSSRGISSFG